MFALDGKTTIVGVFGIILLVAYCFGKLTDAQMILGVGVVTSLVAILVPKQNKTDDSGNNKNP